MTVQEAVDRYYDAWQNKAGDFSDVPLAEDFEFTGPVASFDSAEGYRAMAREAGPAVTSFVVRRQFTDGADPGVVDVSTSWLKPLPKSLRKELEEGRQEQFDRKLRIGERFSRSATALLTFRGEPYGVHDDSRFHLYQVVMRYRLGDEVAQIDTPLLITEPEGEQFWPGQAQQLFDRLSGPKELVRFTAAEGAGRHCEPLAGALRDSRVFDWRDRYLARAA